MEKIKHIINNQKQKENYKEFITELFALCTLEIDYIKYDKQEKIKKDILENFDNIDFPCRYVSIIADNLITVNPKFKWTGLKSS